MSKLTERIAQTKQEIYKLEDQVDAGLLKGDAVIRSVSDTLTRYNDLYLQLEAEELIPYYKERGVQSLITDRAGARPAKWFKESGLKFGTGYASKCFAFLICHEEVGIAAVHINTIRQDDVVAFISRVMDGDKKVLASFSGPDAALSRAIVPQERLLSLLDQAVVLTIDGFGQLLGPNRGIPPEGVVFTGCGIDYLRLYPDGLDSAKQQLVSSIGEHPMMHDGRQLGRGRNVILDFDLLGTAAGFLYDGKVLESYRFK